jgi:hypothetical protein
MGRNASGCIKLYAIYNPPSVSLESLCSFIGRLQDKFLIWGSRFNLTSPTPEGSVDILGVLLANPKNATKAELREEKWFGDL